MRPDFLKAGAIIRGLVLGILFLPGLLWAGTDIDKGVVRQFDMASMPGSSRSGTTPSPIPWSELGAQASVQSRGRGISIRASESGARLESMFQRLAGEVGEHGLQLWSTVKDDPQTRFSVLATGLGRRNGRVAALERAGRVEVEKDLIRFVRSGLVEEYNVSVDGVRQDLVIAEPPPGQGDLRVELFVTGATAQPSERGATLILQGSRRQLSYHRLCVLDARNRRLPARLAVESPRTLAVTVADTEAVYPIRIDPTFSDADWHSMDFFSPGTDSTVYALAVDEAGDLYAGGAFSEAGGAQADYIAKWNGTKWSALGSGVNGTVRALVMGTGGKLYAGGDFTTAGGVDANHVAKWDGSTWSALGLGVDGAVNALAVDGSNNLYAGGVFADYLAMWSGNTWTPIGGVMNGAVRALAVDGASLYVGGDFTTPWAHIVMWNSVFSALGSGTDGPVYALAVDGDGHLYAGGDFGTAGGVSASYIAMWSGTAWSAMGNLNGRVTALITDGDLYAGGDFTQDGSTELNHVARWNGSWEALGGGLNAGVSALAVYSGYYFVGGAFTTAGDEDANHVAKWDVEGTSWKALPSPQDNEVHAFAVDGEGNVYMGGNFTEAGGVSVNRVAKWNGTIWSFLDSYGMDNTVIGLLADGTDLYACGWFTTAGGVSANHIARWNGSTWTGLGSGTNGTNGLVNTMVMDGDGNLYIGGEFTTAGGVSADYVAKWNGSTWTGLGSGVGGTVDALAMDGSGNLYAGGWFNTDSGAPANRIAKWNGSTWSALGAGMDDWVVKALAVDASGNLYAGGLFSAIGGVAYNRIAKWDGSTWSALGSGVNSGYSDGVNALAIDEAGNLYAGGTFTVAGGVSASNIARWDGSSWAALGSGVNNRVSALTASGGKLYVGGVFTQAGGSSAFCAAYADITLPEVTTTTPDPVTSTTASSGGNVTSEGVSSVTERGVCWSTDTNPTINDSKTSDGAGTGVFASSITGLSPGETYHVRAYATNWAGTAYGSDKTFTTTAVTAPTVTTTAVSSVTENSAASGGNVTSDGGATLTARGVCWSTDVNPTIGDSHTDDGSDLGSFSSSITGLTTNTTYHVRAYATNALEMTGYGSDKTFTTSGGVPAGTYYVNISTGNDSNDGSAAHPWKTLHHGISQINAISQVNAGRSATSVLHVALGTYGISHEADSELLLSQDNVIIIGERGSAPIIDGTGAADWPYGIKITGSNVTLKNLHITGFTSTNNPEGTGVEIVGGSNNTVENCRVYGNFDGISVRQSDNCTIQDCEIDNNDFDGISITESANSTITENTIHDNYEKDHSNGIVVQACSPEISRNAIYDNRFNISLKADSGEITSPTIKNNLIYQVTSGEVHFGILMGGAGTANPKIYHNTIDGGLYDGIYMDGVGNAPEIKYNIITGFGQFGVENSDSVGNPIIDYNDTWNNDSGQYDGCVSPPPGANNISADPRFASYSLRSDSPCINTIPSQGDPVDLDYPGYIRPRPGKNTKDMGAYEYVADVTDNYTLPGGTGLATDYRIFTVPLDLGTGARMLGAMEDVLGTYDPVHWRAFLFDGVSYREFNSSQFKSHAIKPGMAFWIITTYTDTIPFEGKPAPDGVNYVMELDPGWHMIGLPWLDTSIFLSSIKVTDGVNTYAVSGPGNDLTQRFLWDYTGADGYVQRTAASFRLQNNKGYFFKVLTDEPIRMIIPNAANLAQDAPVETTPYQTNANDDEEAPPPPPGAEPSPDIKVNGEDGPITLNAGDSASVSITLDPGAWSGRNADWWVAAYTPFSLSWYTYVYPGGWKPGIQVCVQRPLFEIKSPFNILNMVLPNGYYVFYLAVDGNMDGVPDATWMDSVAVNVR